ncbi:hypothetical protein [Luteithermobacter gelatinilyticus]|uniref:hypothetical protein n=1 Tax=Luteithermobacter gelatinilyticus TaxID=2582913 RepID=UPI001106241C|nr:hypothetical protein [Luteithermobacter gelatinilyticus]
MTITCSYRPTVLSVVLLAGLCGLVFGTLMTPDKTFAQDTPTKDIPAKDPPAKDPSSSSSEAETVRREERCLNVRRIRQTRVVDNQTILFYMYGGKVKRVTLLNTCYSLAFHGSFSYRTSTGRLCSGFDHIVSRAGNYCLIDSIIDVTEDLKNQKKKDQNDQ